VPGGVITLQFVITGTGLGNSCRVRASRSISRTSKILEVFVIDEKETFSS